MHLSGDELVVVSRRNRLDGLDELRHVDGLGQGVEGGPAVDDDREDARLQRKLPGAGNDVRSSFRGNSTAWWLLQF